MQVRPHPVVLLTDDCENNDTLALTIEGHLKADLCARRYL